MALLSLVTPREEIVRELAERYDEFTATLHASGPEGSGDGSGLMPSTYTRSVRELEHWLKVMLHDRHEPLVRLPDGARASVRRLRWHVVHHHVQARPRAADAVLVRSKSGHDHPLVDQNGKPLRPKPGHRLVRNPDGTPAVVRVRYLERTGDAKLATAGIRWIAGRFRFEPELPKQVRDAA